LSGRNLALRALGGIFAALSAFVPAAAQSAPAASASLTASISSGPLALERVDPAFLPGFRDDLNFQGLRLAAEQSLAYYRSQPPERLFAFGRDRFPARHLADSMATFIALLEQSSVDFYDRLLEQFWVYQSTGTRTDRTVTFSAYYEHTLEASWTRTKTFRYPLYRRPPDLVEADAGTVDPARAGQKMAGRMVKGRLAPYYTRKDIDSDGVLKGRGLELAWAKDPMDIYFLQVEGSGWLKIQGSTAPVRIRYAANNGHSYKSVGLSMIERGLIPREKFNKDTMLEYLRAHPVQRQDILNTNPRYVFFQVDRSSRAALTLGSLQIALTPWRSVATDPALFPPGALCWMDVAGKTPMTRFALNQDEGGAIKGPGRVDYFVGADPEAEKFAFTVWSPGKLYFLVKKTGGSP
jgi:membrane-bound lytic murein transglycosylase A